MRLVMDACLIALIKIHVVRRDIVGVRAPVWTSKFYSSVGIFLYIEIHIYIVSDIF